MGIGGFSEKDINITNGGGMDSWLPAMLFNNKNGGDLGGNNCLLYLLIFLFLGDGRLGLGRGAGAATVATDIGLSNASLIDTVKTAIATSTGVVTSAIEKSTASVLSSIDNRFAEQTANLTAQNTATREKIAEGFVRSENGIQILNSLTQLGFANLNKSFSDLSLTNCQNQNQLLNAINCATQGIKDSQNAGFSALAGQNAQLFNAITATNCNIDSKFERISCEISNSTRDIIQSQRDIASAAAERDANRLIAEQAARIAKLESCNEHHARREYEGNNVNINNQISVLSNNINNLISALSGSRPGNSGNGNS